MSDLFRILGSSFDFVLALAIFVVPIGLTIWTIVTLLHLKSGQQEIVERLRAIEHRLRQKP